jgi:pentatricopeptide repeat protein
MNLLKDAFVGSAVVDMYAKCGLLVEALEVFESLAARNAIAWNALISGFAQLGKAKEAFDLFQCMEFEGVEPDQATFASILKACSHAGDVVKGHTYFEAMNKSYGITPGLNHHTCMVDLLGRAGQLGEAGEVMNNAPFHPDSVMALALLSACRKWGEIDLAMNVFEHAVGSDEKLASAYVCMYNIYADSVL